MELQKRDLEHELADHKGELGLLLRGVLRELKLQQFVHAGLLLGANVAFAVVAAVASASLDRWPRDWLRVGWRIAASWLAAICALVLAFLLRPLP